MGRRRASSSKRVSSSGANPCCAAGMDGVRQQDLEPGQLGGGRLLVQHDLVAGQVLGSVVVAMVPAVVVAGDDPQREPARGQQLAGEVVLAAAVVGEITLHDGLGAPVRQLAQRTQAHDRMGAVSIGRQVQRGARPKPVSPTWRSDTVASGRGTVREEQAACAASWPDDRRSRRGTRCRRPTCRRPRRPRPRAR